MKSSNKNEVRPYIYFGIVIDDNRECRIKQTFSKGVPITVLFILLLVLSTSVHISYLITMQMFLLH